MLRFLNKKFSTCINFSNVSPDYPDHPISESFHNLANLTDLRKAISKLSLVESKYLKSYLFGIVNISDVVLDLEARPCPQGQILLSLASKVQTFASRVEALAS